MMAITQASEFKQNSEATMRRCGPCQECCTVLPVRPLGKAENTRCVHQGTRGCTIYDKRPQVCRDFECFWKLGVFKRHLRPDKIGAVVWTTKNVGTRGEQMNVLACSLRSGQKVKPELMAWLMRRSHAFVVQIMAASKISLYQDGRHILTWNEGDFFSWDLIDGKIANAKAIPRAAVLVTEADERNWAQHIDDTMES